MTNIETRDDFIALMNATCSTISENVWYTVEGTEVRAYLTIWAVDNGDSDDTIAGRFADTKKPLCTDLRDVYMRDYFGMRRLFKLGSWAAENED